MSTDLLDEFDGLDDLMDAPLQSAPSNKAGAQPKTNPSASTSSMHEIAEQVMLATNQMQEAASLNQEVIELNTQLTQDLKDQIEDKNIEGANWRNQLRQSQTQLTSNRNAVIGLTVFSIIFGITSMGVSAYLLNLQEQKSMQFQGEVYEMIRTEDAMFQKQLTRKLDEMSSMLEGVTYQVQQAVENNQMSNTQAMATDSHTPAATHDTHHNAMPHETDTHSAQHDVTPVYEPANTHHDKHTPLESTHTTHDAHAVPATVNAHHNDGHTPSPTTHGSTETHELKAEIAKQTKQWQTELTQISQLMFQLQQQQSSLGEMVKESNQRQAVVEAAIHKLNHSPSAAPSSQGSASLSATQAQQLKDVHWLVSKQQTKILALQEQIKKLQSTVEQGGMNSAPTSAANKTDTSLKSVEVSIENLKQQQQMIAGQLKEVQSNVKMLVDKSKQAYSYRAEPIKMN